VAEPTPDIPRRALLKSVEVCEIIKVQPYVLRSWEKEFPDLGTARSAGGPRFYRPSDLERVQRLKQLVFGEGLTLAGARRRLEEERDAQHADALPFEDPLALSPDTRERINGVRRGLRSLLEMLSKPGSAPTPVLRPVVEPKPKQEGPRAAAPAKRRNVSRRGEARAAK